MTEDMLENNAYHFIKNYPNINVLKPSEWNNEEYLNMLKHEEYDLLFANNPCSGLSAINRNANLNQPINNKFFEVFDTVNAIQPKVFLIENAPTLVTIGTPILQHMINILNDYKITIIRDMAGNHNVAMKRTRTFIIGWRKDYFENKIPLINMNIQNPIFIKDVLGTISNDTYNKEVVKHNYSNLIKYYNLVNKGDSVLRTIYKFCNDIKSDLTETQINSIKTMKKKKQDNKNIWDKSPWRLDENKRAPSMTSLSAFIHPTEDRDLYIREYARIMGYPEDFIFYPNECKCSTIQCIAQGVPVNFIKYISNEIIRCLKRNYNLIEDVDIIFQNHISKNYFKFNKQEFLNINNLLNATSNPIKLT